MKAHDRLRQNCGRYVFLNPEVYNDEGRRGKGGTLSAAVPGIPNTLNPRHISFR